MSPLLLLAAPASYLAGSIPFGLLVARAATGADVREVGSGNIGATNVARAAGRGAAVATLVLDAAKGFAPAWLASHLFAGSALTGTALARVAPGANEALAPWAGAICGVLAVVGHCFPVWLRFRGGKGVATGLGVALALAPWAALAGAATWVVLYKLFRISSVGSLAGIAVTLTVAALTAPAPAVAALGAIALLVVVRHRANLHRLLRRQER